MTPSPLKPLLRRVLLLGGWLFSAGVAAPLFAAPASPIEILAPASGPSLTSGLPAELAWEPAPGARLPAGDEWEAFLSLDGGKSYTVRITPHLHRTVRRITWTVPEVPSDAVRILLRFGDEHRELVVEVPRTYQIVGRLGGRLAVERVARRGEPARPGEPGVAVWVEGTRTGGGQRWVMALTSSLSSDLDRKPESQARRWVRLKRRRRVPVPREHCPVARNEVRPSQPRDPAIQRPLFGVDRLLQTSRRNE
jgi:hypothetical protein